MFTYLSLLIDRGFFDSIQVNFLIVGHTHTSVDRYFSLVSKAIRKAAFIGSPLSMQNLFNNIQSPMVNRKLTVFYDYKKWLSDVINTSLRWYSLPHVFLFSRHPLGRCFCQHMPLSTSPKFLPEQPDNCYNLSTASASDIDSLLVPLQVDATSVLGGRENITTALVGNGSIRPKGHSGITQENVEAARAVQLAHSLRNDVDNILIGSAYEHDRLLEHESENGYHVVLNLTPEVVEGNQEEETLIRGFTAEDRQKLDLGCNNRPEDLKDLINDQNQLKNLGDSKKGYCFWIDYTKCDDKWMGSIPDTLNPNRDVSKVYTTIYIVIVV